MKKWKIHVIPHTHWDKEWYFTKATSNVFLAKNLDKIYSYFKQNKNKMAQYTFDSQYSVVDDYCEMDPNGLSKIKEMVKENKLVVSPWYTQTDTFNVTGESIVRNMLTGVKESQKLGNHMKVAYMPDSFGFNANLPQIFKSFDMKAFIHWRGVKQEQINDGIFNKWKGLDGTEILEYNLYKFGYSCGGIYMNELFKDGYDKDDVKTNASKIFGLVQSDYRDMLKNLKAVSKNGNKNILFPWGTDQMAYFENFEEVISELNKLDTENEWIINDYESFINLLTEEVDTNSLKLLDHELRFGQFSRVHKTINSGRWDIKTGIKQLEYLIYSVVEPLNVIFKKLGGDYSEALILRALKMLFECQAHDSAGGCNTDETNNSVVERLHNGIDMMESLVVYIQRQIVHKMKLKENELIAFNLQPEKVETTLKMKVFTSKPNFEILDKDNNKLLFKVVNQVLVDPENFECYEFNDLEVNNNCNYVFWTEIEIPEVSFEKLSVKKLLVKNIEKPLHKIITEKTVLENDFWKISLENSKIKLLNKKTNETIDDAFQIKSDFDAGDSYDYSPVSFEQCDTNELLQVKSMLCNSNGLETLKVAFEFLVPISLENKEKTTQWVDLCISLNKDFIDLNVSLENKASDIRWRLITNTNIKSEESYSDTSFGVIKRKYEYEDERKKWISENWNDYPTDIESVESVVWLQEKNIKSGLFVNGINEFQIIGDQKEKIALTLFRAYSLIGRKNMVYRPGRASGIEQYPHQTPNANLINKKILINIRVLLQSTKNFVKESKQWCIPTVYFQNQNLNNFHAKGKMFSLPTETINELKYDQPLLENLPDLNKDLVVSALKKKYDGESIILRFYNPTETEINISELSKYNHLNLKEEISNVKNVIKPNEFITIEIK